MKPSGQPSLLKFCLLMLMLVSYTDAFVIGAPKGGHVVSGTASFTQDGNLTVVTAGNRSVINYTGFDIAKGETVQFVQPGAHATVLNRVTTPDPTNIFGTLRSNGIVIISNPYGVFFQNGSVINVGGLIAGAGKISDADFTAGKIHFTDLTGDVRNDGVIAADNRIALLGANVANTGSLTAAHGMAMMVSGPDLYVGEKSGNIFVQANGKALQAAATATGATAAAASAGSVKNSGTVAAPRVVLGAGDMYSTAIVNSGLLQGRTVAVNAGKNGSAKIGGTLDASSARNPTATGRGGSIQVLGGTVALQGATLDASGGAGGGSVRVGGDFHGAGTLARSATTSVDAATTIKADATGNTGNGGTVVLWSDQATAYSGQINVGAGAKGGDGGQVEVSSHGTLGFNGSMVASAPGGKPGSLLLDPTNIEISGTGGTAVPTSGTVSGGAAGNTTISATSLEALDGGTSITLQADQDIRIDNLATRTDGGTAGVLNLKPGTGTVLFQAGFNGTGSFVMANATTTTLLGATTPADTIAAPGRNVTILANGPTASGGINGGVLGLGGSTNAIQIGAINTAAAGQGGSINLLTTGATQPAAVPVQFETLTSTGTGAGGIGGAVTVARQTAATTAFPTAIAAGVINTAGTVTPGNINLTTVPASGAITFAATPTFTGNTALTAHAINTPAALNGGGFDLTLTVSQTVNLSLVASGTVHNFLSNGANGTNIDVAAFSTTGSQTYGNPVTLSLNTTLTALNSGGVTFNGAVDSSATTVMATTTTDAHTLTVNTGGVTLINAPLGGTYALGAFTTDASLGGTSDVTEFNVAGATPAVTTVNNGTATGAQTYGDGVRLLADTTLASTVSGAATTPGTITFSNVVATLATAPVTAFGLSLTNAGTTTFNSIVGNGIAATALSFLSTGTGTTRFNGDSVVGGQVITSGALGQTFNGPVVLGVASGTAAIPAVTTFSAGTGPVNFTKTVDGSAAGTQALAVSSSGTATFGGAVGQAGAAGATALASVATAAGEAVHLNGPGVSTTSAQNYPGTVTLGATTALASSAGTVTLGPVTGASFGLTVNGTGSSVGTISGAGALNFNDGPGVASFSGNVTGTSFSSMGSGGVTFTSPATLTATTGDAGIAGPLTLGGATTLASTLGRVNVGSVAGGGFDLTINGTGSNFGTISNGGSVMFNDGAGVATFTGDIGSTGFASMGSGGVTFTRAATVQTTGSQLFTGLLTLGGTTTLKSTTPSGISVGSLAGGGFDLTVNGLTTSFGTITNGGNLNFTVGSGVGAAFSSTVDAASLAVTGGKTGLSGNVTTHSLALGQSYGGGVSVGATLTLSDTAAGNISFSSVVNGTSQGGQLLTVKTDGTTTFNGTVGSTIPLGGLTVSGNTTAAAGSTIFNVSGGGSTVTTYTDGTATDTGAQTYSNAVKLAQDTSLQSTSVNAGTTDGPVSFGSTVGSLTAPHALTIGTTGLTTFGGLVGGPAGTGGENITAVPALASLSVTGGGTVDINGGGVTTLSAAGGTQTYSGPVVLGANAVLTGRSVTFTGGVSSAAGAGSPFGLTLDLSAQITLPGLDLSGIGDFASIGTGGVLFTGGLSTYGSQTYLFGPVTLASDVTLTAGTGNANGSITLGSLVDDQTAGTHKLTLTAGSAGTVFIQTAIGSMSPLLSLTALTRQTGGASSAEPVKINAVGVTTTGAQSYGLLTLGGTGTTTLTSTGAGGSITSGTVTGGGNGLTVSAPGTGSTSTFAPITGAGAVDFEVKGTANFNGPISATSLTLGATTPGTVGNLSVGTVTTSAGQIYNEPLTLQTGTTLTDSAGSAIILSAVNSLSMATPQSLAVNTAGVTTFKGAIGANFPLTSVTTAAPGTTQINGGAVSTSGAAGQVYGGAVTLGATAATTTLTATNSGVVTFGGTLESAGTTTAQALTINTAGLTTFKGRVGGAPGGEIAGVLTAPALASLTTTGGGLVNVNGGSVTTVTAGTGTVGTQSYSGKVTLGTDTLFKGRTAAFTGGITSAGAGSPFNLTIDLFDQLTLPGTSGLSDLTGVRNFTSVGPGGVSINGTITTAGDQTYRNGSVTISGNSTLTAGSSMATGSINLNSAVDDLTSGAHTLTLVTGASGGVNVNAPIGGSTPLLSLTATASQNAGVPESVTINATSVKTLGSQAYGKLTLGGTGLTTLTSTSTTLNAGISAGSVVGLGNPLTVNAASATGTSTFGAITGAGALNFNVAGMLQLNGPVTATSLTAGPGVSIALGGGTVTTSAGQTYNEKMFLGVDTTLADTGTQNISLLAVDSATATPVSLKINTAGITIFGGAVGAGNALASVTTDAPGSTQLNGGLVRTANAAGQVYNDSVTLGAPTTLTANGAGVVTFAETLGSAGTTPEALTINTSGLTTFSKQVGGASTVGASALASLMTTGGGEVDIQSGVTTVATAGGVQSYGGLVRLNGNTTLAGYSLTLGMGLAGQGFDLLLNFTAQTTLPNGIAGVNNFTTTGAGGVLLNGGFTTNGSQTYSNGPVALGGASTLTSTTGSLTFNTPVDGNASLALNATGAGGQVLFNAAALVGNGTPVGALTSNTAAGTVFGMNAGTSTTGNGGVTAASVAITGPVTFNETGSTLPTTAHPSILTTGPQTYSGAATLALDTSLVSPGGGGAIAFNTTAATIDSAVGTLRALNVGTAGLQTFTGLIGATTALSSLTTGTGTALFNLTIPANAPAGVRVQGPVTVGGPATFNVSGSSLTQPSLLTLGSGSQIYNGVVTLQGPVTVLNSADTEGSAGTFLGGGSIIFKGNVVSPSGTSELDVRAGVGTAEFDAPITTTGDFAPGGASVAFHGSVGPLGTFTVQPNGGGTGPGLIDLNGGSFTSGGLQLYNLPVVLSANTVLQAGGNVTFVSTLDGSNLLTNNPYTLAINVNGGLISFNGVVGGTVPLASLTTGNTGALAGTTRFNMALPLAGSGLGGVNVLGAVTINTNADFETSDLVTDTVPTILSGAPYRGQAGTGTQTFGAAVTLGQNTVLKDVAAAGSITFNGRVNATADGGASLSVNSNGDEVFNQLVGDQFALASLSTDNLSGGAGSTRFNLDLSQAGATAGVRVAGTVNVSDRMVFNATGGSVHPTVLSGGAQNYALAATVARDTVLTAGGGNITFGGAVDGVLGAAAALQVNTPSNEVFNGLVGASAPLASLTTDATGAATGQAQFVMTLPLTGLAPGVGGVNTTGGVTINDAVLFQVANTAGAPGNHPSVVSGGTQTYQGAATLGALTVLTSNGGSIVFASTLDSDALATPHALTLNTPTAGSTATVAQAVGGTFPLASLRTNGSGTTQLNGGLVVTTGTQQYVQAVTLGADTTLHTLDAGGNVVFGNALDGAHNLEVDADAASFLAVGNTAPLLNLTVTAPAGITFTYTLGLVTAGNAGVNVRDLLTLNGPAFFDAANAGNVVFVRTGLPGTTGSGQEYFGALTLAGTATFTDATNGRIIFHQAVDGASAAGLSDLTINTGGPLTFLGPVGGTVALSSLHTGNLGNPAGSTNLVGGSVTTVGTQVYNDNVFLGAATTLTSTASSPIVLALLVNSTSAQTPQALTVNTSGQTIFGGAVGSTSPLASLITDNGGAADLGTFINGGRITTTGAQTFNDGATLGAATTLTSTAGGDITFARTLDSNAAPPQTLAVNTNGRTVFGGAVGSANPLASLTTDNGGAADLGTFINGGRITTTGAQTFNDGATLGANTILASTANGALTFNGTVNGAFALTLNTGGLTAFNNLVGNTAQLTALTTDNASAAGEATQFNMTVGAAVAGVVVNGPVTINDAVQFNAQGASLAQPGVLTVGNGTQTYNGPATLGTSTFLVSASALPTGGAAFTGGGAIRFNSPQGVASAGGGGLFVRAGVGAATFASAINANNVDLGGAAATFLGPINVTGTLSVEPNDNAGGGSVTINGGSLTTVGAQIYNAAFILGGNTVLTSTGSGTIRFGSTVDGPFALTLNSTGDEIFNGRVGGITPLASLTTDNPIFGQRGGHVIFAFAGGTTAAPSVTTIGAQTFNDAAILRADTVLASTGAGITFALTVDSDAAATPRALTLNAAGDETFNGRVGGSQALIRLLTDDAAGTISGGRTIFNVAGSTTAAPGVTTTGAQTFNDAVLLQTGTVLASTGGGTIKFTSTVDGPFALTLNSTGDEVFDARVGGTAALLSLITDDPAANTTGGHAIFNVPGGARSVTTTGVQTYHDAVTLVADTNLTSTNGGALTFTSTVDGPFALTLNTSGTTTFQNAVGNAAALASLTTSTGVVAFNGRTVTTTGLQSYGGVALLGADTTLTSMAATGGITFSAGIDSDATPRALTLNAVGDETFNGRIGSGGALLSLTTDDPASGVSGGRVVFNIAGSTSAAPGVTTVGAQTYHDAALLQTDTVLASTNGGTLTFVSTVDGPLALTLNTSGNEVFGAAVGGTRALTSLTTDNLAAATGGHVIFGITGLTTALGVTTTGAQTFNDAATLLADATLASTGSGTLTFASTVDGPFALTLNSKGDEVFNGQIGGGSALASLATDAVAGSVGGSVNFNFAGTGNAPSVRTTGAQVYHDAATLRANTALTSTNAGRLAFTSTVDNGNAANPRDLTLNSAGDELFGGVVGGSKPIGNLSVDTTGTAGGQTTFGMTVSGGQPGVNVRGMVTVNDRVLFNAPGSALATPTVQSTGAQTYGGAATLGQDTVLASSGGAPVAFGSTINGGHALLVNTVGLTTFGGAVGGSEALASLSTLGGGEVVLNGGTVATSGAQLFSGAATLGRDTALTSGAAGIEFGGTVNGRFALTLTTPSPAAATTFDQSVGNTTALTTLTAADGSAVVLNGGNVTTLGLQTYGGTLTINGTGQTILAATNDETSADLTQRGNVVFKQAVGVNNGGSLLVQGRRILAQAPANITVADAGNLDLEASDVLILQGSSYSSDSGKIILNDNPQAGIAAATTQPRATIFLTNPRTTFHGGGFEMGYLQNLYSLGSVSILVPGGTATLSDIAASGTLNVAAGAIVLRARNPDPARGGLTGGIDDGLNFVAGQSINFGQTVLRYDNTYSANDQANFVTTTGLVTVNRDSSKGISIFQDQALAAAFARTNGSLNFSDNNFYGFITPFQPISGGTQTIDTAAALSGALPDQKPIDVAVDITVTASQMEELKKLGIHPRMAAKQERVSLNSKRALFAQLVDGQDQDNYGLLQPIKGGISRLVPSDYVVVVDRMSEREVQSILTAFEQLYGKNKEKVPPIGEGFNTAFNDYSNEKQTADPSGLAAYIQSKPGKYPEVEKAVRGFDNLFGYIESLGLTSKEQAKSKEHIASDLQVAGVSSEDMVKVIDALRAKIPKDQKAPSTKLPPSPPANNPAPGATSPAPPVKKTEPPLKTARHQKKDSVRKTASQTKPAREDRVHEVAGL